MKIKDLREGMDDVEIEAVIDYIIPNDDVGYGESWGIVFVHDETKDIKMIFNEKEMKQAEVGKKIRVQHGHVTNFRGELQLNTKKKYPVEFLS